MIRDEATSVTPGRLPLVAHPEAVRPPRYPVVFMHGMGIIAHLLKPGSVLDDMAAYLRTQGIAAYAPQVSPYNDAPVRAQLWDQHCRRILAETGQPKLNLVGFSSGGLDARFLVSRMEAHRYVASVTTVATPHRGSSLPGLVFKLPPSAKKAWLALVHALARWFFPALEPDTERTLRELTPAYAEQHFNPSVPDHPEVAYYSFAARAGTGAPYPPSLLMWGFNKVLYALEGVNDGFVSVRSARWSGYSGCIDADHAQLAGIGHARGRFDARCFYHACLAGLAMQGH